MDQARAASRRQQPRHKLEKLGIPEKELTLTDALLGKGGFGSVYIADYNGRNAAAKGLPIEHDLAGLGGSDSNPDATGGKQVIGGVRWFRDVRASSLETRGPRTEIFSGVGSSVVVIEWIEISAGCNGRRQTFLISVISMP